MVGEEENAREDLEQALQIFRETGARRDQELVDSSLLTTLRFAMPGRRFRSRRKRKTAELA